MNTELLTVKEVAKYLKMCQITIYRLAKAGKIPAFKVGGDWRFKQSSIEKWIDENENSNGINGVNYKKELISKGA